MPNKYYIDVKNNLRQVPKEKEGAFLKKYPGSRLATDKELTDFEDNIAKNRELTQRESNIQNGQGSSTDKTSTNQPLSGFNFGFGANQPQKMKTKFKDGTEGYVDIPTVNTNIPQLKEPNLLENPAFKGKPLKETIADTIQNMPVSSEAYFDMAVDRYKQEKENIDRIKNDNTISESVKQSLINDYQTNIRTSDDTVEDKHLPPAAKEWLERNKVSREVTHYNPSMMGGGSYTTTVRENTPEQIAFIKDYIANSTDGKQYAQAHKEFIGQLENQTDALLDEVNSIRDKSAKDKETYAKKHNTSTFFLKGTNYRNDAILDKSANLLKNTKLLLESNRDGGGFWKGLHMTDEDLKELAVLTESFYNDKVLNQVIDKYQKDPNSLSKEENIIIQAKYIADQITAGVDPGSWYNIGATTKQSLPFMRDFILTAPIGGGVASGVKGGLSALAGKTGANFLLSRGAGGVVSNLAKGAIDLSVRPAVQTMFSPSSYAMAFQEMQGQAIDRDEQGNVRFDNRKTAEHGMTSAFIENQSEVLGEVVLDKLFQKFKIPVPAFLKTSAAKRLSSATGIQGPITEYAEEKYSDLANIVRGEQTIEGFFDPRSNLETFGAVAVMQIPFSAINSTGYGIGKIRDVQAKRAIRQTYDKSTTNLTDYFGEDAEQAIAGFNNLVDNSSEEELREALTSVIEDERLDDNAKRAIVEYVTSYSAYSGINKAKQEEVQQVQEQVTQQVQENVNPDMDAIVMAKVGGYEDPVQIWNGHIEYNEDGTINREKSSQSVTIINKDGKKVPVSINFVEELVENIPTEEATAQLSELATQEVTARQENDEVREYQAGERVRTIDGAIGRVAENEDGSVMTDDNGNYIVLVDTPAGSQQIATEPRNIINEDNLIGVENGSEVTYTNEQGEKAEGVVSTTPDLYAQGLIGFENGEVIPIVNVEGLKQENDMQLPPPPADMMIGDNGAEPYNPNVSNSQETTNIAEQNEQSVTTAPSEQNILTDIDTIINNAPKQKNGKIDYNALMENNPADFASLWENRSGYESTRNQLKKVSDNIGSQIESEEKKLEKETDFNKIADIEDRINALQARKQGIDEVVSSRYPESEQQVTEQLTGEEVIENPTIPIESKKEKVVREKKPTPFQKRLNAVEDNVSTIRDRILFGIASGAYKFRWKDKGVSMGLAREIGLTGSEEERKSRIGILRNDGYTPSTLAHRIWEETGMELDDNDIRSEVIDVLSSVYSRSQALEELERNAGITEEQYQQEVEQESEYLKELREQEEALILEGYEQTTEKDLLSLRSRAIEYGATENQLDEVFTISDYIDLIQELEDGQESDTRTNRNETSTTVSEELSTDSTQRATIERNRSTEETGNSRQDSDSARDGRSTQQEELTPEEQRVVDNATKEIDAEIAEAEKELTTQQKELSSARKKLGKAQADTQTNLFGNEQQDKLFDVPADLSKENAVDNILSPIQQQIDAAQTKLDNLTNSRDARIQEALDNHRKQGKVFEQEEAPTNLAIKKGYNPAHFNKGDIVIDKYRGDIYEIIEPDKRGMAVLENVNTKARQDYNAHNNAHFILYEQTIEDKIAQAEAETDTNPSEAQKKAGNYKKGKVTIQGFGITIESVKGEERSGTDTTGKKWSVTLNNSYGYFRKTEGKDKDHIDLFLGNNPNSNLVFVVDQVNQDKSFDEHKVMFGFDSIEEARGAYLSNYEEGWQGLGSITAVDVETFRKWTDSDTRRIKPFGEYKEIENREDKAQRDIDAYEDQIGQEFPNVKELESAETRVEELEAQMQEELKVIEAEESKDTVEAIDIDTIVNDNTEDPEDDPTPPRGGRRQTSSSGSFESVPADKFDRLVDKLNETGLATNVIIEDNINDNQQIENANGDVYGYVTPEGVIHLDGKRMNANTPIHEFGHLWNSFTKENDTALYNRGVELIKQSPYWERVNNNTDYASLSEEQAADEAIAMAIGDKGEAITNRSLKQQFVDWLSEVWQSIKRTFGINTNVSLADMTLSDFTDRAVSELLGGKELSSTPSNTSSDIRLQSVDDINAATEELDSKLKGLFFRFREGWEDSMLAVKRFQEMLEKHGTKIDEYNNFYLKATHMRSINQAQEELYKETIEKPLESAISKIIEKGYALRDVENYAILKHGLERNEVMRQKAIDKYKEANPDATIEQIASYESRLPNDYSGVTAVEDEVGKHAEWYISDFEDAVGSDLIDDFWKKIKTATQFSLKKDLEGQRISKKQYEDVTSQFEYYIPLRGHDDIVAEDKYDYTPNMGTYFSNPLIQANGRRSRSEKPFAFITQMAMSSISAGNQNVEKQKILRLALKDKTGLMRVSKAWYEHKGQIEGEDVWEKVQPTYSTNAEEFQKNIEDFETRMQELAEQGKATQKRDKLKLGMFIKPSQAQQHEVHVTQNGVDYVVYINANPAVARAINGENLVHLGKVAESITDVSRFMAANFTTRNPLFIAKNFQRDYTYASSILTVKESAKYALEFQKNIPDAAGALQRYLRGAADLTKAQDNFLVEFIMNGGKTGFSHMLELQELQKAFEKGLKKIDKKDYLRNVLDVLEAGNEFAENLSRLSVYITSRKDGRSITKSISDAKNVTVNFNKGGSGQMGAAYIRPLYLFANAAIQSISNKAHVAKNNPKKAAALFAFNAIAPTLMGMALASLIGGDDGLEDYLNMNEWERQNHLLIYTGNGFIKWSLPHELRVWNRIGDNFVQAYHGKKDYAEAIKEIPSSFSDLLPIDPTAASDASWAEYMPDFTRPFFQLVANSNFMGGRIYNEWIDPNTPGYLKARTNKKGKTMAPDLLVNATKTLDNLTGGDGVEQGVISLNPDLVEHFARGYFGGLYTFLMRSANTVAGLTGDDELSIRDTPLKDFFVSSEDIQVSSSGINKKFYEVKDEVKEIRRKIKGYENQANKGDISVEDFAKKISSLSSDIEKLQRVYPLMQEIDKYEKTLKELDGEDQRKIERHISDWKKQVIQLND